MDPVTEDELGTLLDQVDSDDGVRAVVFTGGMPDVFIRHYDVGVLSATAERMAGREMPLCFSPVVCTAAHGLTVKI